LANGYLIDIAYERGSVNTTLELETLKRLSDITARARQVGDGDGFSAAIREGLPSRLPHLSEEAITGQAHPRSARTRMAQLGTSARILRR
jgi:hypothetical protein